MNKEIFYKITGYENIYEISNKGRIKSLKRTIKTKKGITKTIKEKILKQNDDKRGYNKVTLINKNGIKKNWKVHKIAQLILFADSDLTINIIDHKDNNRHNNNFNNLRIVTQSQNARNRKKSKKKTSKYKGVSFNKKLKKWETYIYINKKKKIIGYYYNEKQAGLNYNREAKFQFGKYANLNSIEPNQ